MAANKNKQNAKKSADKKPARQWQKTVAHVVEAALQAAGGRGASVAAIVKATGLTEEQAERHLLYMANKLDGFNLKNPRATVKNGVYKLVSVGHFRGTDAIKIARSRFMTKAQQAAAAKRDSE